MTSKLSKDTLIQFLKEKKLEPTIEEDSGLVVVVQKIDKAEIAIFFNIMADDTLLQTMAYLPLEVHEKAVADTARTLHLLNRDSEIPGYGLDEERYLVFFRCAIPCINKILDTAVLERMLIVTRLSIETFLPAIAMVASGAASIDQILAEGKKQQKREKA